MEIKDTISLLNTTLYDAFAKKHLSIFAKLSKDKKQIDYIVRGPSIMLAQKLYDEIEEGMKEPTKKNTFTKISSITEEVLKNTEESKLSGGTWTSLGIGNGSVYITYKFS